MLFDYQLNRQHTTQLKFRAIDRELTIGFKRSQQIERKPAAPKALRSVFCAELGVQRAAKRARREYECVSQQP